MDRRKVLIVTDAADIHSVAADSPVVIRWGTNADVVPINCLMPTPSGTDILVHPASGLRVLAAPGQWHWIEHISCHPYSGEMNRMICDMGMVDVTPNHSLLDSNLLEVTPQWAFDNSTELYVRQPSLTELFNLDSDECLRRGMIMASLPQYLDEIPTELPLVGPVSEQEISPFYRGFNDVRQLAIPMDLLNCKASQKLSFLSGYRQVCDPSGHTVTAVSQLTLSGLLAMFASVSDLAYTISSNDWSFTIADTPWTDELIASACMPRHLQSYNYDGWVYDIQCADGGHDEPHSFCTGVGGFRVHNTGLGKCAREVFNRLAKDPVFEIRQFGLSNSQGVEKINFPIARPSGDADKHGEKSLIPLIRDYKPDLIWSNHDVWNLVHLLKARQSGGFKLIWQPFIESLPLRRQLGVLWNQADMIVPPTEYARRALLSLPDIDKTKIEAVLGVGVDRSIFSKADAKEKAELRHKYLMRTREFVTLKDPFIIGFNGRNFFRKMTWSLFHLASMLIHKKYGKCENCGKIIPYARDYEWQGWIEPSCCGNIVPPNDWGVPPPDFGFWFHIPANDIGWRLESLMDHYNIRRRVLITDGYQVARGIKEEKLSEFYNCLDCYVSFASEGWGMPYCEAMACGVPVISPASSGGYEVTKDLGLNWTPSEFIPDVDLSCARALPNWQSVLEQLFKVVDNQRHYQREAKRLSGRYNWSSVTNKWKELLLRFPKNPDGVTLI